MPVVLLSPVPTENNSQYIISDQEPSVGSKLAVRAIATGAVPVICVTPSSCFVVPSAQPAKRTGMFVAVGLYMPTVVTCGRALWLPMLNQMPRVDAIT